MGLFCQMVDIGDGGYFGLDFLGEFDGPQGAVGLEDAQFGKRLVIGALGARLITADAVEHGGGLRVAEVVEGAERGLGLEAAEALEVPGGVEEFLERGPFNGALRIEFGFEGGAEGFERLRVRPRERRGDWPPWRTALEATRAFFSSVRGP